MENKKYADLLIGIITNNQGIEIQYPDINSVVQEVFTCTGVLIGAKPMPDVYLSERTDRYGGKYCMKRVNRRQFTLNIKSHEFH